MHSGDKIKPEICKPTHVAYYDGAPSYLGGGGGGGHRAHTCYCLKFSLASEPVVPLRSRLPFGNGMQDYLAGYLTGC